MTLNTDKDMVSPLARRAACHHCRDEESGTTWAWFPWLFQSKTDAGAEKTFIAPRPGSAALSESRWTVLVSNPAVDRPGERPMRILMDLGDVLALCGVERCRRAMVFAHQRAAVDAKRRVTSLSGPVVDIARARPGAERGPRVARSVSAYLDKQLSDIGQFAPTGRSRSGSDAEPADDRAEVVDLQRRRVLRESALTPTEGDDEGEPPFEQQRVGCYASRGDGSACREIVVTGSDDLWILSDTLEQPRGEDGDVDFRSLPMPFDNREEALEEGRRQLRLALREGGPSADFQA